MSTSKGWGVNRHNMHLYPWSRSLSWQVGEGYGNEDVRQLRFGSRVHFYIHVPRIALYKRTCIIDCHSEDPVCIVFSQQTDATVSFNNRLTANSILMQCMSELNLHAAG